MAQRPSIQHTNTDGDILTFTVTIGGETREVKFRKDSPTALTTNYDYTMAAQVGQGTKVHRAEVHARQNTDTGEWFLLARALGKCNNVRLVGWADQFENTAVGNVQSNRYRI